MNSVKPSCQVRFHRNDDQVSVKEFMCIGDSKSSNSVLSKCDLQKAKTKDFFVQIFRKHLNFVMLNPSVFRISTSQVLLFAAEFLLVCERCLVQKIVRMISLNKVLRWPQALLQRSLTLTLDPTAPMACPRQPPSRGRNSILMKRTQTLCRRKLQFLQRLQGRESRI